MDHVESVGSKLHSREVFANHVSSKGQVIWRNSAFGTVHLENREKDANTPPKKIQESKQATRAPAGELLAVG